MKTRNNNVNNKGFSLVEVIVSMAILAIIALPLLSYFTSSAQYNGRAKTKQEAVNLAQSIMEQCKDTSLEEIAKSFHASTTDFPTVFHLVKPSQILNPSDVTKPDVMVEELKGDGTSVGTKGLSGSYAGAYTPPTPVPVTPGVTAPTIDGSLRYVIRNIQEDGNRYDALITIDTSINAADKYYATNNTEKLFNINAINAPNNVVAVESSQKARAIQRMLSLNSTECAAQNAANINNAAWTEKIAKTYAEIEAAIIRKMVIEMQPITGNATSIKVKIYYKYYCETTIEGGQGSTGAFEIDPPLFNETVALSSLQNIYLFFNMEKLNEQVILNIDSSLDSRFLNPFNLYLLCQKDSTNAVPTCNVDVEVRPAFLKLKQVYYNLNSVTKNGVPDSILFNNEYITSAGSIRMVNTRVDIFRAGSLTAPGSLLNPESIGGYLATIQSTKGE